MHIKDLRQLPDEFDFKSKINPFGILYHAKERTHDYEVTCDISTQRWSISKHDMRMHLYHDEYLLVT